MQLSNKGKIVLILLGVLVIAFVILYFFNKKNQTELPATESPGSEDIFAPETTEVSASPALSGEILESPQSIDQTIGSSPTTSATTVATKSVSPTMSSTKVARTPVTKTDASGVRSYKVAITPAPNSGPLDWTRTEKEITVYDFTKSIYAQKSFCELAGLSDSWSNAIEKVTCDTMNFLNEKIGEQLAELACGAYVSGIQSNYKNTITYEYRDGACLVIDR